MIDRFIIEWPNKKTIEQGFVYLILAIFSPAIGWFDLYDFLRFKFVLRAQHWYYLKYEALPALLSRYYGLDKGEWTIEFFREREIGGSLKAKFTGGVNGIIDITYNNRNIDASMGREESDNDVKS